MKGLCGYPQEIVVLHRSSTPLCPQPVYQDGFTGCFVSQVGPLASVRICRDAVTGQSLSYGYVNYDSSLDPEAGVNFSLLPCLPSPPPSTFPSHPYHTIHRHTLQQEDNHADCFSVLSPPFTSYEPPLLIFAQMGVCLRLTPLLYADSSIVQTVSSKMLPFASLYTLYTPSLPPSPTLPTPSTLY